MSAAALESFIFLSGISCGLLPKQPAHQDALVAQEEQAAVESPILRPSPNSSGRGGIRPPSHQVSVMGGMSARAGNLKRTMVERG